MGPMTLEVIRYHSLYTLYTVYSVYTVLYPGKLQRAKLPGPFVVLEGKTWGRLQVLYKESVSFLTFTLDCIELLIL